VTPWLLDKALRAGESPEKHSLVPYGIRVPSGVPKSAPEEICEIRRRLNLPLDNKIVLSVGWISREHKRMDYTINEVASLPEPRPHLVLLGRMDEASPPVLELARQRLGDANFTARSVPYEAVAEYYASADVFVLSSLVEAFGRVYLEALMAGLPCVVHENAVTKYVLAEEGFFADLSTQSNLTEALTKVLARTISPQDRARRRESVRRRFDWDVLAPSYIEMFRKCCEKQR
jgi:glycosyltransferase involved in cell wall biosynthesis